jgi:hypothetical protein
MQQAESNALVRAPKSRAAPVIFLHLKPGRARGASLAGSVATVHALADASA